MRINRAGRWIATIGLAFCATTAHAGRELLADGAFDDVADSNFLSDGQFWHASTDSNAASGILAIPFDFGSGPVSGLRFLFGSADGTVRFANASNVPTGEFIAPLQVPGGFNPAYQNGRFTFGELAPAILNNPFAVGPFVYDPSTTLKAYRFTWQGLCPLNDGVCTFNQLLNFQAVLISVDTEDFVLQFNYQNFTDASAGSGSFLLGTNTGTYGGPFLDSGPNFCFRGGTQVSCSQVTGVPEPETNTLIALGVLMLGGMTWRRRSDLVRARSAA